MVAVASGDSVVARFLACAVPRSMNWSAANTSLRNPRCAASSASTTRPLTSQSVAWVRPIMRGSSQDKPYSAGSAKRGEAEVILAPSAA